MTDVAEMIVDAATFENRLRAHLRQRMERRRLGVTAAAKLLDFDQPYVSRWLRGERGDRGISAFFAYRMSKAFGIDPDQLFNVDPPENFWRSYVPRATPEDPGEASPAHARPPRQAGERAAEAAAGSQHVPKKAR